MSKPFDSGPDEAQGNAQNQDWADGELRRACAELDGHIPDDYFEGFSSRLAAKLEAEPMETMNDDLNTASSSGNSPMAINPGATKVAASAGESDDRDEHSGLHEIKALASSAREKIQRRRTTESDFEDSLLASSSTGLPAVALPDPERSTPNMAVLSSSSPSLEMPSLGEFSVDAPIDTASASASQFGAGLQQHNAPKPWLWVAIGGTALAAGAVALLLLMGGDDKTKSSAAGDTLAVASEAKTETTNAPRGAAPPPPAAAPVVSSLPEPQLASGDNVESAADEGAIADAPIGGSPRAAAVAGATGIDADAVQNERAKKAKAKAEVRAFEAEKRREKDTDKAETKGKVDKADAVKEDKKEKKPSEAGGDINSILDEVTGGKSVATPDAEEEAKPDKKRLGSGDVKRAMSGIKGRVNRCGTKADFTGRVSMRFSVAPSGKVSRAKAKTSDAKVARCVEAAVKSAKFPSFEPPSMTFSYPFHLTD